MHGQRFTKAKEGELLDAQTLNYYAIKTKEVIVP